jgi:hypothetical protein
MKIRNGFVSNSSSSSFVILKESLSEKQKDMVLNYISWIDHFVKLDKKLRDRFEYYKSDRWEITEYEDFIFGETSMDNFSISDFFEYININKDYIAWDDGYNYEPYQSQLDFIKRMKQKYRKDKIDKINKSN